MRYVKRFNARGSNKAIRFHKEYRVFVALKPGTKAAKKAEARLKRAGRSLVAKESIFRMNIRPLCSPFPSFFFFSFFFFIPSFHALDPIQKRESRRLGNFVALAAMTTRTMAHSQSTTSPRIDRVYCCLRRRVEKVARLINRPSRSTKPWKVGC